VRRSGSDSVAAGGAGWRGRRRASRAATRDARVTWASAADPVSSASRSARRWEAGSERELGVRELGDDLLVRVARRLSPSSRDDLVQGFCAEKHGERVDVSLDVELAAGLRAAPAPPESRARDVERLSRRRALRPSPRRSPRPGRGDPPLGLGKAGLQRAASAVRSGIARPGWFAVRRPATRSRTAGSSARAHVAVTRRPRAARQKTASRAGR
jgi:hypothetical protein